VTATATPTRETSPRDGWSVRGLMLAGAATAVSGLSVWVNSYGVHAIRSASVYTTAKNLVAAVLLIAVAAFVHPARHERPGGATNGSPATPRRRPTPLRTALGVGYVGAIGGGLAFVLFFNGLAQTSATSAAFWRDTLVIWVAAMAVPILREKLLWWNLAAVALLIAGQIVLAGGVGHLAVDKGQLLVLGSSLLWGVEVVIVKTLLAGLSPRTTGALRMGLGSVVLVGYLAVTGHLGGLARLDGRQAVWAVLTGALLAVYVLGWMAALSRARAVDVTSILVASALVTWLLQAASGTAPPGSRSLGLVMIAVGAAVVAWASARHAVSSTPRSLVAAVRRVL
jgi:drug/metabolite transporter (DMT)-like permease